MSETYDQAARLTCHDAIVGGDGADSASDIAMREAVAFAAVTSVEALRDIQIKYPPSGRAQNDRTAAGGGAGDRPMVQRTPLELSGCSGDPAFAADAGGVQAHQRQIDALEGGVLPKSPHSAAEKALAEIWNAEDKDHAPAAAKEFEPPGFVCALELKHRDHQGR
ncbi:hypothetical protein [Actinomadura nitritigenes]|uniref:hypothetical protein n=1 Tax=Actinomadura nitritigenes TaxID=134602 RepID=UPI003D8B1E80